MDLKKILTAGAFALATAGCGENKTQSTRTEALDTRESISVEGRVIESKQFHPTGKVYSTGGMIQIVESPIKTDLRIKSGENVYHVTTTGNKWERIDEKDRVYLSGTCKQQGCKVNGNGDIDLVFARVGLKYNK